VDFIDRETPERLQNGLRGETDATGRNANNRDRAALYEIFD